MSPSERIRLNLDLDLASEPIEGEVRAAGGSSHPFVGWLGLTTALVRRAHEELVAAGARPRRLQFSGLEALTASERRICELAAEGCTNKEIAQRLFVTPKTVENHLGRAYVKLGIGSREALRGVLGDPPGEDEGRPLMS